MLNIHHSIADGISTLKLIVEGFGQTKATTSESSQAAAKLLSLLDRLQYYLKVLILLFQKIVKSAVYTYLFQQMTLNHPWRHKISSNQAIPVVLC